METALRAISVEPTIASQPTSIGGRRPLQAQRALVVHLHGDRLNPTSMRNTPEELASYAPEADPTPVSQLASDLLKQRGATYVQAARSEHTYARPDPAFCNKG
ncbi:hypothetical protein [Streptomyces sp. MZ04]|uniref:hypothetical protein n=1 Tax=Streptomyces sp. MZ04 TaxID=2559236 RepID=UPI00107EC1FF|nr:hypothetical protein [Streptomyces sp. MZ04]TGB15405.1 hypothetical protein E2651_03030 [Streptomyces sp. MZ04]